MGYLNRKMARSKQFPPWGVGGAPDSTIAEPVAKCRQRNSKAAAGKALTQLGSSRHPFPCGIRNTMILLPHKKRHTATIGGVKYDTRGAKQIAESKDVDGPHFTTLYQNRRGGKLFFLRLEHWQVGPVAAKCQTDEEVDNPARQVEKRFSIRPATRQEALKWVIKDDSKVPRFFRRELLQGRSSLTPRTRRLPPARRHSGPGVHFQLALPFNSGITLRANPCNQ
jgi:hypothetical protein